MNDNEHSRSKKLKSSVSRACKYCGRLFTGSLSEYMCHVKWCHKNPESESGRSACREMQRKYCKHVAWNRGKTKESDTRIAKAADSLRARYASGDLIGSFRGKRHSEESKRRMSESGRKNPYQRVCKKTVEYNMKDGSVVRLDSSYEVTVAKLLDTWGVKWTRPKPLVWIDKYGKNHNYFPDFLLSDFDIYLDPKNEYCFKAQKEKIEYVKEHYKNVLFLQEEDIKEEALLSRLTALGVCFTRRV